MDRSNLRPVTPRLLRQMNVRRVLDALRRDGAISRADLMKVTGISAPTMSSLMAALLETGLVEQESQSRRTAGRPRAIYRLASRRVQVLGAVVSARDCAVLATGLDGRVDEQRVRLYATPPSYDELIRQLAQNLGGVRDLSGAPCLGIGLSVPGLVRAADGCVVFSPNLHFLDGRHPGRDLARRLGLPTVLVQEEHGLCLAEQTFGAARGADHFVMVDISEGLGMGVVNDGRLMTGSSGFGGEIGHITVQADGERCGCGNRGCLETVATDRAFARLVSRKAGRTLGIEKAVEEVRAGAIDAEAEIQATLGYLAVGLGAIINILNPQLLFVYGRLFEARDGLFDELVARVRRHALAPSYTGCRIVRARGNKTQGALAAVIHNLVDNYGPRVV